MITNKFLKSLKIEKILKRKSLQIAILSILLSACVPTLSQRIFEAVEPGDSKEDVKAQFGTPRSFVSSTQDPRDEVWIYQNLYFVCGIRFSHETQKVLDRTCTQTARKIEPLFKIPNDSVDANCTTMNFGTGMSRTNCRVRQ